MRNSQILERVLPLMNRVSTPRGPTARSSWGVVPATRRAAPARWLGEAYPRIRTTARTVYPGLPSRSAAQAVRARSITRLRLGAPPAANCREHTSELQSRRDLVCRLLLEKKKLIGITSVIRTAPHISTISPE